MKVTGDATVSAPAESVRAALRDPDRLARIIPGCEGFEVTSAGKCWLTVTTALPGVDGTYTGEASVRERQAPGVLVATVSVAGVQGTIAADVSVRLASADDGATQLSYDVDAEFDGAIAGVGKRMLAGIAKRIAGEFIAELDDELVAEARAAEALAASPRVPRPASPAGPGEGTDRPPARAGVGSADFDQARAGAGLAAATSAGSDQPRGGSGPDRPRGDMSPDRPWGAVGLEGWSGAKAGLLAGGVLAVTATAIAVVAVLGRRRRAARRNGS